jgi:hypothetical protein
LPITNNSSQNTQTIPPQERLSPSVRHHAEGSSYEDKRLNATSSIPPHKKNKKIIEFRNQPSHEKKNPYCSQSHSNPRIHESKTDRSGGSDAEPSLGDHEACNLPIPQPGDRTPILPRIQNDLILREIGKHQKSSRYWEKRHLNDALAKTLADPFRTLEPCGYHLYLVTLTYKQSQTGFLTIPKATDRLKQFYRTVLLPLLVHRRSYHKSKYRHLHPILYAFPDVPGSKRSDGEDDPAYSRSRAGVHHHAIMAVHPDIVEKADELRGRDTLCIPPFMDYRKSSLIQTSDCQPIIPETLENAISYVTKWASWQQFTEDEWFIVLGDSYPMPAPCSTDNRPAEQPITHDISATTFESQVENTMTKRLNWTTRRHDGKPREAAMPAKARRKGAWTHVRREKCRTFTPEQRAEWCHENGYQNNVIEPIKRAVPTNDSH